MFAEVYLHLNSTLRYRRKLCIIGKEKFKYIERHLAAKLKLIVSSKIKRFGTLDSV